MSYILDALKKSDQQRQQHQGPSLQTVHRPIVNTNQSSLWMLIAVLLVLILVVAVAIISYLYVNSSSLEHVVANKEGSVTMPVQLSEQQSVVKQAVVEKQPELSQPLTMAAVPFNALSTEQRALIPGMTFSFHIYSDNPIHRTIIINGRRVKQGEWVEQGLLLEEITTKGVVMNWNDQLRFSIDVVESW